MRTKPIAPVVSFSSRRRSGVAEKTILDVRQGFFTTCAAVMMGEGCGHKALHSDYKNSE
jgi:hypothetical protein